MAEGLVVPLMPKPGEMVGLSSAFSPALMQGITVNKDNALQFDFIMNRGQDNLSDADKTLEYNKLIKYFLASLTIADKDQWVNLSPYEKERIIEDGFGRTEMGRDLLAQDYLLKQITSSLMYPENGLGKTFWDKIYERVGKEFGSINIPVNTFNKVWIVPSDVTVYESGTSAVILKSHLKVMLEEDYLATQKHQVIQNKTAVQEIIRDVILPELEKEVNTGKNFAPLRQVVSAMILATWYKKSLKESLLGKVYMDQAKVQGINTDPKNNTIIYDQYLEAFKKGVYNFIKEEVNPKTQQLIPRKYFAGGIQGIQEMNVVQNIDRAMVDPTDIGVDFLIPDIDIVRSEVKPARFELSPGPLPVMSIRQRSWNALDSQVIADKVFKYLSTKYKGYALLGKVFQVNVSATDIVEGRRLEVAAIGLDAKEQDPISLLKEQFMDGRMLPLKIRFTDKGIKVSLGEILESFLEPNEINDYLVNTNIVLNKVQQQLNQMWDQEATVNKNLTTPVQDLKTDIKIFQNNQDGSIRLDGIKNEVEVNILGEKYKVIKQLKSGGFEWVLILPNLQFFYFKVRLTRQYPVEFLTTDLEGHYIVKDGKKIPIEFVLYSKEDRNQLIIRMGNKLLFSDITLGDTKTDRAMLNNINQVVVDRQGGIDLNAEHFDMLIKRDEKGVVLPFALQDLEKLQSIQGFTPRILEIKPAVNVPILSEIQERLKMAQSAS